MLHYLIMCKSLTYAQRAARTLERAGITATVSRAPQGLSQDGCAYCVKVPERKLDVSLRLIREAGLPYGRVFYQDEGGQAREVRR